MHLKGEGRKGGGEGGAWDNRSMRHEIIPWRTAHGSKVEAGRLRKQHEKMFEQQQNQKQEQEQQQLQEQLWIATSEPEQVSALV